MPQRHLSVAFLAPGVPVTLRARKPEYRRLDGDSLGARLQRRRLELGLRRVEVAAQMGCDPKSLMGWERGEREPFVSAYPAIIDFLGYEPWPEPRTLAEALLAERRRRGLSLADAASLMGVDEGTWRRWEIGAWKPMGRTTAALGELLGFDVRLAFPEAVR